MDPSSESTLDCLICGQQHATTEPHVYDYADDVDDDLTCHICLQPFVEPTDLPCGHTLCGPCLFSYLRLHAACPIDRLPLVPARCGASSLVLRRILEKLPVKCPNVTVCTQTIQRGDLEGHLKNRCKGAAKQRCLATSPPASKMVAVSSPNASPVANPVANPVASPVANPVANPVTNPVDDQQPQMTIRAKSITRLPVLEGEISHIEIPRVSPNLGITIVGGADTALRCVVVQEVFADGLVAQDGRLRPGDQLIEINGVDMTNASHHQACQALRKVAPVLRLGVYRERIEAYTSRSWAHYIEEVHTVRLERQPHQQLGVRLSGWWIEPGIYVLEVMEGSPAAASGRLEPYDRIVSVNGEDVASCRLDHASQLIQSNEKVTLVIARKKMSRAISESTPGTRDSSYQQPPLPSVPVFHGRTKSAPESLGDVNQPSLPTCSGRTPAPRAESYDSLPAQQSLQSQASCDSPLSLPSQLEEISGNIKRIIRVSGHQLHQKKVTINKEPNESLGMRIGGGLGSNEGNIPIYIANIHPQGCVGRTQQIWKGDILLDVNGTSLIGLTHSQAVATLKSTAENVQVILGILEGPETYHGSLNFIPSWLYWQKLPRCLQFPKTVVLHRSPGASLGFSIVGGEDPVRGPESIHILFVVQDSPAAKDGKLRCGDRLLSVDGNSLDNVKHSLAVSMLKQTGSKVTLEVVSWLGTEL